jgi:hypothetical protein
MLPLLPPITSSGEPFMRHQTGVAATSSKSICSAVAHRHSETAGYNTGAEILQTTFEGEMGCTVVCLPFTGPYHGYVHAPLRQQPSNSVGTIWLLSRPQF